jgi:hypothetical protein
MACPGAEEVEEQIYSGMPHVLLPTKMERRKGLCHIIVSMLVVLEAG